MPLRESALAGFTLVEMLVVLSIIVVITTVVVTGQTSFNRSLLLTDTAYTIAFSIREAQVLGLSSRTFSSIPDAGYGIRFSRTLPTSYVEFADINPSGAGSSLGGLCPGHAALAGTPDARPGNCLYNSPAELVRTYTLGRGFYVSSFCGTDANGAQKCTPGDFDQLDITFMRPSTNAVILGIRSSTYTPLSDAYIRLKSPDGVSERCIFVTKVGQIAVKTCP